MIRFLILCFISNQAFSATFHIHRGAWYRSYHRTHNSYQDEERRREEDRKRGRGEYLQSLKERPNIFKYKYGHGMGYGCGKRSSCEWGYGGGYGCGTKKYISDCKIRVEKMWSEEGKKRYHLERKKSN